MSKHTPTPWVADLEYTDEGNKARVFRNAAFQYALTEYGTMSDEDAAFIVRAVNAHDRLVAALSDLLDVGLDTESAQTDSEYCAAIDARRRARAALSAAKE